MAVRYDVAGSILPHSHDTSYLLVTQSIMVTSRIPVDKVFCSISRKDIVNGLHQ